MANCELRIANAAVRVAEVVRGLALALATSWLIVGSAAGQGITAGLERHTISLGESTRLSLVLSGGTLNAEPILPLVPGLDITREGASRNLTLINGQMSASFTFSFRLTPQREGDFTIPTFNITVDGKPQACPPVQLKVLARGAPAPDAPELSKLAFMRLIPSRTNCYVGEIFPIEIQLLHQTGRNEQFPNLRCEGFTVGKMVGTRSRAQFGNMLYNLVTFKTLVTPVKSGKLALGPAECALNVGVRPAVPDPFLIGGLVYREYSPRSDAVEINVEPLPTNNVPPGFSGAVGDFQMTFSAGPTNVLVGDPITVKVQITGRGALDNVMLSTPEAWREFKTYAPTIKSDNFDPMSVMGVKNFEQIIVPQNVEISELPALAFSYFDPQQKAYRTLTQGPVKLTVRPGNASAQQPTIVTDTATTQNAPPTANDIVHIKPQLGAVGALRPALVTQPWFLALQAVPVAAWLALVVRRKRADALANNPRLRRQRMVAVVIEAGLAELRRQAAANLGAEFFATTIRLLQEQLGERLDLPASAITESVVEEWLVPAAVGAAELTALRELFHACDNARFAKEPTAQELAALLPKVETVLASLRGIEVPA